MWKNISTGLDQYSATYDNLILIGTRRRKYVGLTKYIQPENSYETKNML